MKKLVRTGETKEKDKIINRALDNMKNPDVQLCEVIKVEKMKLY